MKRRCLAACMAVMLVLLAGCRKSVINDISLIYDDYVKKLHRYTTVKKGDITPFLELNLKPDEYRVKSYGLTLNELEVLSLNVEKGDYVTAGTVMATFKNDGIEEQILEKKENKDELLLLIDHYERLSAIEGQEAYKETIASLKKEVEIIDAYIKEDEARLLDYILVAEEDGVVTDISKELYGGYSGYGESLIKVASGSDNYYVETGDEYEFHVGDEFTATHGIAVYTLKIIDIRTEDGKKQITFLPISDMSGITKSDTLLLHIDKAVLKDVLYVEADAVFRVNDKYYVFSLDEQGYKHAVEVFPQCFVDGYAILNDELSDGEQVTLE